MAVLTIAFSSLTFGLTDTAIGRGRREDAVVTVRLIDLCAALWWAASGGLAFLDMLTPGPPGELSVWAIICAAVAAPLTAIAWLSRHLHAYDRGMRDGLEAARIVRLRDRERV